MMPCGVARYDQAGKMVSLIGELAGVKVYTHPKTGKVKFASAHDLRRSFGTRWSKVVSASELQDMMCHATITLPKRTTLTIRPLTLPGASTARPERIWVLFSVLLATPATVPWSVQATQLTMVSRLR